MFHNLESEQLSHSYGVGVKYSKSKVQKVCVTFVSFKMSLLLTGKNAKIKMRLAMTRVQVLCCLIIITRKLATSRLAHLTGPVSLARSRLIDVTCQVAHVQVKLLTQVKTNFNTTVLSVSRTLGRIVAEVEVVEFFKAFSWILKL